MIRVLIAEDEPPIARQIVSMIRRLDSAFVPDVAGDGEQALRLMAQQPYDLVMTDIRMPMMNGLQLMEIIQARWPDALMVVISGYGSFEYTSHALRAHAFDYLLKPVAEADMKDLLQRLKLAHLERRRAKLERLMATGINRAPAAAPAGDESGQRVFVALMCAGSELGPEGGAYWSALNLEALIGELLGELKSFTWAFMGDTPNERVVMLEARAGMVELMEYVHEHMLGTAPLPISCACLNAEVPLPETRAALKRLGDALRHRPDWSKSEFLLLGDQPPAPQSEPARELVERVRAFLDQNYARHITNQTLSDEFGYVPSYIALLFRRGLGMSPSEYLAQLRLERAKQLMEQQPRLMVKEVAERVGFKNQYHFSKAFKKHTGLWPTGYKDREG